MHFSFSVYFCLHRISATPKCVHAYIGLCWRKLIICSDSFGRRLMHCIPPLLQVAKFMVKWCLMLSIWIGIYLRWMSLKLPAGIRPITCCFNEWNSNKHFFSKVLPVRLIKAEGQPSYQLLKFTFSCGQAIREIVREYFSILRRNSKGITFIWNVL